MPKIVDRDIRRREIVDAYLRLVARDGMAQASTRALASELRISTGALWHYFTDFDEVLLLAYGQVFARTSDRIVEGCSGRRGLFALTAMLTELLPLTKVTQDEAAVVVSFWGRVPYDLALGECHAAFESEWRERLRECLAEAVEEGQLIPGTPLTAVADVVFVLAAGLQVEYVVRTELTDAERQWRLMAAVIAPWMTESGHDAGAIPGHIGILSASA